MILALVRITLIAAAIYVAYWLATLPPTAFR